MLHSSFCFTSRFPFLQPRAMTGETPSQFSLALAASMNRPAQTNYQCNGSDISGWLHQGFWRQPAVHRRGLVAWARCPARTAPCMRCSKTRAPARCMSAAVSMSWALGSPVGGEVGRDELVEFRLRIGRTIRALALDGVGISTPAARSRIPVCRPPTLPDGMGATGSA